LRPAPRQRTLRIQKQHKIQATAPTRKWHACGEKSPERVKVEDKNNKYGKGASRFWDYQKDSGFPYWSVLPSLSPPWFSKGFN